jgi:GT2 family glycosyltransferase
MPNSIPVLIIPVLNRFELLEIVLDSIDYPVDNILIVDNSNSYKTNRPNIHVLNMPSNFGVAGSWNLGIKSFPHAPYWLIGSNDNQWESGSLERMSVESNENSLVFSSQGWNSFSIGSNIIKNIGLFDENYYPAYHEDTDYIERIRLHKMNDSVKKTDILVNSYGSGTTMHSNPQFIERNKTTGENNRLYYMDKIYGEDEHYDCYFWDLQRRIDNDWTK